MDAIKASLFSEKLDFLLVSGLSLITLLLILIFHDWINTNDLWFASWVLAFFINGPHFLISYLLFYRLSGKRALKEKQLIVPALVVPFVLGAIWFSSGVLNKNEILMGLLYAMFFFVGWHYVKQAFGILIVNSALKKNYFSSIELRNIRYAIYTLWIASFLSMFGKDFRVDQYWGLEYAIPALPELIINTSQSIAILGLIYLIVFFVIRYQKGIKDSVNGLSGFFVNYVWLLPIFYNPNYALLIPLFHSLQYMLFAGNVVKNIEKEKPEPKPFLYWWAPAFILAALGFHFIPEILESFIGSPEGFGEAQFYLIGFIIFINIHHYFIDSVLWKREVGLTRDYLKPI